MLLRLVLLVSTRETRPYVTDYGLTPPFVDQFFPAVASSCPFSIFQDASWLQLVQVR